MRQFIPAITTLALFTPLSAQRALTATPQLTIDGVEHDFSRVGRLAVSARGVIAVPQPQDGRILFFDARGTSLGSVGRAGAGPGEFRAPGLLGWTGDTLVVFDLQLRRITLIDPDLKLLRTVPVPQEVQPPGGAGGVPLVASLYPVAALDAAGMIATVILRRGGSFPKWIPFDGEAGTAYLRLGVDGRFQKLIAVRGSLEDCSVSTTNTTLVIPFCFRPLDANSPNGRHVVTVTPGARGRYSVVAVDGVSGDTAFARQYSYQPVPVPKRVADSVLESRASMTGGPAGMAEMWRRMRVAETYPALTRAVVGNDGSIWLEEQTLAPALRRWRVLDRAGAVTGVVSMPRNVSLWVVARDQVWATVDDDDDVQDVVRYGVR